MIHHCLLRPNDLALDDYAAGLVSLPEKTRVKLPEIDLSTK